MGIRRQSRQPSSLAQVEVAGLARLSALRRRNAKVGTFWQKLSYSTAPFAALAVALLLAVSYQFHSESQTAEERVAPSETLTPQAVPSARSHFAGTTPPRDPVPPETQLQRFEREYGELLRHAKALLMEKRDPEAILSALRKAQRIRLTAEWPPYADAELNHLLAKTLTLLKKWREAVSYWRLSIRDKPQNGASVFYLAVCLLMDAADAADAGTPIPDAAASAVEAEIAVLVDKAIELEPSVSRRAGNGEWLMLLLRCDLAIKIFDSVLRLDPSHTDARRNKHKCEQQLTADAEVARLTSRLSDSALGSAQLEVLRSEPIDLVTFVEDYARQRRPLVIPGGSSGLTFDTWSPEKLASECESSAMLTPLRHSSTVRQPNTRTPSRARLEAAPDVGPLSFPQLLGSLSQLSEPVAAWEASLMHHCPNLLPFLSIPSWANNDYLQRMPRTLATNWELRDASPVLVVATQGMRFNLHEQPWSSHAWVAQLYGRQRVVVYPKSQRHLLYPSTVSQAYMVDAYAADFQRHPLFFHANSSFALLQQGDLMFLPSGSVQRGEVVSPISIALIGRYVDDTNLDDVVAALRDMSPSDLPAAVEIAEHLERFGTARSRGTGGHSSDGSDARGTGGDRGYYEHKGVSSLLELHAWRDHRTQSSK